MAILGTKTMNSGNADGVAKKPRAKAPTINQRFENFIDDLVQALHRDSSEAVNNLAGSIEGIARHVMSRHLTKTSGATGGARGVFYQVFGANPEIGMCVSPNEVSDRTDGKGALTEAILKRWADSTKGVPYGKGATAVVVFYKRAKMSDGSIAEAHYKLESYTPAPAASTDEGFNL
jgi:hypothetical protein